LEPLRNAQFQTVGFTALGFPSDGLLRHNQKRLIYGVPLFEKATDFLCGRTDKVPEYLHCSENYCDPSAQRLSITGAVAG
jgi:hypothetical protein